MYIPYRMHCPFRDLRFYTWIYRHGLENKTTSLHCYVASVQNTSLLFGYVLQVLTWRQLHINISSVSHLTTLTHFVQCGSKNGQ